MARTLQINSRGDDVRFLQDRLNSHPLTVLPSLLVDGEFGPKTQAHVKEVQRNSSLTADGVVGPATWNGLLGRETTETIGFFVLEGNLYDRFGTRVVLRGINKMSVFDESDAFGLISFPEIKKTGANTVRIVWAMTEDLDPNGVPTSSATLDALIKNAKVNHLIPMVELHDATGNWSRLDELVDYWTKPEITTVIARHQHYLLVNIGNEVGDDTVSKADFLAAYSAAVQRMRKANIRTPLVIDASTWGKDLAMLNNTAADLLSADPDSNLIFSVHLYWSQSCGYDSASIKRVLEEASNLKYPLIVGEFSRYGGYPCNEPEASICSAGGEINYKAILAVCHDLEIGWYVWEWGPGNDFEDPLCAVMDMTPDRLFNNLKPGWAHEVAISSPFGIRRTSITPTSI